MITKVLLDTDIGSDIDDAVALAYLLSHPDCELLGITTVTGEANKRAALASVICIAAGKSIPIYPGADSPLHGKQRQATAPQAGVLPRWPHQSDFPMNQAVDFLANTIRAYPGEVMLLTIGPLTNAGLLFSQHPDVAELLGGFVMMGGNFDASGSEAGQAEWNIVCDPIAAELTYKAPVRLHRSIGLNVTKQVIMPADDVHNEFTAPLLRPVLDMADVWFAGSHPVITFHDPLAAATVFDPALCSYEQGTVSFEIADQPGETIFKPGVPAPHQVAITVDVDRFFQHFFSVLGS